MKTLTAKTTGMSLLELREKFGTGEGGFWDNTWWFDEAFANEKPPAGEYELILDKKYTSLTFDEQKKKMPKGYEVCHPAIVMEAILTHNKSGAEKLLEDWWVRTSARSSDGRLVFVGDFGSRGALVGYGNPRYSSSDLGVVFSRSVSAPTRDLNPDALTLESLGQRLERLEKLVNPELLK